MVVGDSLNPELRRELMPVAAKVFWWTGSEEAFPSTTRFAAQVMTYGDWTDVDKGLRCLGEEVFRRALENAPPGVFDARSWNFWHLFFHITPVPPLPQRRL